MYYRLYFLGASEHIKDVDQFECQTDRQAMIIAEQRAASRSFELWCGTRLILRQWTEVPVKN